MNLKTQTVYVSTYKPSKLKVGSIDENDYYKSFSSIDTVESKEAVVLTIEELKKLLEDAIEHGLNSYYDFDRTSNYDRESREQGLKEIQEEFINEIL